MEIKDFNINISKECFGYKNLKDAIESKFIIDIINKRYIIFDNSLQTITINKSNRTSGYIIDLQILFIDDNSLYEYSFHISYKYLNINMHIDNDITFEQFNKDYIKKIEEKLIRYFNYYVLNKEDYDKVNIYKYSIDKSHLLYDMFQKYLKLSTLE